MPDLNLLKLLIILSGLIPYNLQLDIKAENIPEVGTRIVDLNIDHIVGEQIDFQAKVEPSDNVKEIDIFIVAEDKSLLARETLTPTSQGDIYYIYKIFQPAIRVNSELSIWFEVKLTDGTHQTTEPTKYFYNDNRFEWQSLQTDEFMVFWYQEDPDFGHKLLTAAKDGYSKINQLVRLPSPEGITIYAYDNVIDLQEILKFSGEATSWVAGHANPALGTMVVSLPPGPDQEIKISQQIPHELVHILLHQMNGDGYHNIPRWLNEGLASSAELFPNPEFQLLLIKAYERGSLLPIESLCKNFPIDAANFQLAYAEAYSFTSFLHNEYGKEKMEKLIKAYGQGQTCDQAVKAIYKLSLTEVEKDWRQEVFSEPPGLTINQDTISLMILIGVAFIVPLGMMVIGIRKHQERMRN